MEARNKSNVGIMSVSMQGRLSCQSLRLAELIQSTRHRIHNEGVLLADYIQNETWTASNRGFLVRPLIELRTEQHAILARFAHPHLWRKWTMRLLRRQLIYQEQKMKQLIKTFINYRELEGSRRRLCFCHFWPHLVYIHGINLWLVELNLISSYLFPSAPKLQIWWNPQTVYKIWCCCSRTEGQTNYLKAQSLQQTSTVRSNSGGRNKNTLCWRIQNPFASTSLRVTARLHGKTPSAPIQNYATAMET